MTSFPEDTTRRFTQKERLTNKLMELSKTANTISDLYRETLRELINHFSDVWYFSEENERVGVKVFHSFPERVISKKFQDNTLVLPIITVGQVASEYDQDRGRFSPVLVNEAWWDDETERAIRVISLSPVPVTIKYEVSIWAKYSSDLDTMTHMLRMKFNPAMEIDPPASPRAKVFLTGEDNDSSVNVGDGEDRVLRKKLLISVETYINHPKYRVSSTGKINLIVGDFRICRK